MLVGRVADLCGLGVEVPREKAPFAGITDDVAVIVVPVVVVTMISEVALSHHSTGGFVSKCDAHDLGPFVLRLDMIQVVETFRGVEYVLVYIDTDVVRVARLHERTKVACPDQHGQNCDDASLEYSY